MPLAETVWQWLSAQWLLISWNKPTLKKLHKIEIINILKIKESSFLINTIGYNKNIIFI
jgi:hypothetical protein